MRITENKNEVIVSSDYLPQDESRDTILKWIRNNNPTKQEIIDYLLDNQSRFRLPDHQNCFSYPSYLENSCGLIREKSELRYDLTDFGMRSLTFNF